MASFLVTRPGGPVPGSSADTWQTLADRASALSDSRVSARDLIDENVQRGATANEINAWLKSIGGPLTRDGSNRHFPAGASIRLPFGVIVSVGEDESAGGFRHFPELRPGAAIVAKPEDLNLDVAKPEDLNLDVGPQPDIAPLVSGGSGSKIPLFALALAVLLVLLFSSSSSDGAADATR